jgi:hypothetical protein
MVIKHSFTGGYKIQHSNIIFVSLDTLRADHLGH